VGRILRLVIGDGRSVRDRTTSSDRVGVSEDRFDQRRLAGVVRSDECNIP
jgi:hypothetical protein